MTKRSSPTSCSLFSLESDLNVAEIRGADPRLLGTVDRFCNDVREEVRKTSKFAVRHALVIRHVNEWHSTILVHRAAAWNAVGAEGVGL